jgi:ABC-type transporter Mla subunit MlaD
MVERVRVFLPSLPFINNSRRILATFRVPEVSDIERAVEQNVPRLGEIRGEVEDAITNQVVQPLEGINSQLVSIPPTIIETLDESIAEVEAGVAEIDIPTVDEIFEPISEGINDVIATVERQVGNVQDEITDTVNDVRTNVETAIEESTDAIDETVEGISGGLAEVGDVVGDVRDTVESIQSDAADLLDAVPDDFETAVQDAIEAIEPTFNESGLFSDPVGFAIGFVQASADEIVDPEVSQDLQDRVEDR